MLAPPIRPGRRAGTAAVAAFALWGSAAAALGGMTACLYEPPRLLPSSIRLVYSKTTQDSLGARVDIYFLVAREGNELRLTGETGDDRQPTFVHRLRKVFFTRRAEERDEIWSMDLDGSREEAVLAEAGVDYREPAVSADATRIAYTRVSAGREEVWTADIDGSNARALLTDGGPWRLPAWSPDGRRLAVIGGPEGAARLVIVDAGGGAPQPLAPGEPTPQSDPDWSPDGSRIAFVRGAGREAEISVVEVATRAVLRLTDNEAQDTSPTWSPDGEHIAFVSLRPNDRHNVWMMGSDGSDVLPLTRHERSEARDPDWL